MTATIAAEIAELEHRIHIAECQNARPITLEILSSRLWDLKREAARQVLAEQFVKARPVAA